MIVIPPIEITDSRLTASNVPEDDYDEWDDTTTYGVDDFVIVLDGDSVSYNNVYQSVDADNTGNKPWEDDVDNPQFWNLIGKINRWKMFELDRNTQTVGEDSIEVEITPGTRINTVAIFGLQAEEAQAVMTVDSEEVYNQTIELYTRDTLTWADYFFNPFVFQRAGFFEDLPPFTEGVLTVTISRASGEVLCGGLVIGSSVYLGSVERNAESDALNFSTVDRDEFGNARLVPRRTIPKTFQRVFTEKSRVDKLVQTRRDLNAVPAVWSSLDDAEDGYFNALFILGFYRKFLISLENPQHAITQLELEEI